MLHYETVSPELLELLKFLMAQPELSEFNLVGGTSLALQMGHRISVDIDLFGHQELDDIDIQGILAEFGESTLIKKSKSIQIFSTTSIKTDFVNYRYPLLDTPLSIDHIRLASMRDIAAMKLNAIAGRGSKKDFIDLFYLLNSFSLVDMIFFYKKKYTDGSEFLVTKSLCYFLDADLEETPILLQPITWEEVKARILTETNKLI